MSQGTGLPARHPSECAPDSDAMTASAAAAASEELFLEPEDSGDPDGDAGRARLAVSWSPGNDATAPVWVFLHGLGSDRHGDKARRFRDHLAGRGPGFLALDFTGHGDSGGDCLGLSLTRNLDDLDRAVGFVRERAPEAPVHLAGSSMGGIAALWYAALHPAAARRVFAIAPAFLMAARLAASLSAAARRDWATNGAFPLAVGDRELRIGWGGVADEGRYPFDDLANRLQTSALLIHGDADAVVPVELSRDFAAACAAAELVEIEGGDHRLSEEKDLLFEIMWTAASGAPGA